MQLFEVGTIWSLCGVVVELDDGGRDGAGCGVIGGDGLGWTGIGYTWMGWAELNVIVMASMLLYLEE